MRHIFLSSYIAIGTLISFCLKSHPHLKAHPYFHPHGDLILAFHIKTNSHINVSIPPIAREPLDEGTTYILRLLKLRLLFIHVYSEPVKQHLQDELERVTHERDQLAAQMKADSQLLDSKIQAAREQGTYC